MIINMKNFITILFLLLSLFSSAQISSARKLLLSQTSECPVYLDNGGLQYTYYDLGDIEVNYPSTVNQGDDLILVVFTAENVAKTINTPSGWTVIENNTSSNENGYAVFYKQAIGNEDGSQVTVNAYNDGNSIFFGTILRFNSSNSYQNILSGDSFSPLASSDGVLYSFSEGELGIALLMFTGTNYSNAIAVSGGDNFPYSDSMSNSNQGGGRLIVQYGCNGSYDYSWTTSPLNNVRACEKVLKLIN